MKKIVFFLLLLCVGFLGFAQTTVSYDFSDPGAVAGLDEVSPGISLDANIGFGSFKNSGTSNPAIYSGQLRLYQNDTKGGSIKIYATNGATITKVVVNASDRTGPAAFTVDGGAATDIAGGGTYTMNGLSATSEVEFYQKDASSSNRIYVDNFEVTYTPGTPPSVDAPTFSPAAGSYFTAQDVTMTTTTAGADIYYTTDNTDPDNTSTMYTAPVNVAATTTLKAVAFDGTNYSTITTGTYTIVTTVQVADMATLRAQPDDNSTIYELTGEAFLTYQQSYRNKKYIQDATAGIEIDDPSGVISTTYNIYDGITGILGKLNTYNGILQFVPVMDPGAASSTGNTVTPLEITADEFNNNQDMYECRLVKINNLTFDDAGGTFSTGTEYPTVDQLGTGVLFRTNFYDASYIGNTIPSGAQDITGIVYEYNGTPQFTARETTDIVPHAPVIPVSSGGIIIAGLLIAAVLVIRRGRLF